MPEGDYLRRVRDVLGGQLAPRSPEGGTRILYRCPECGLPHYQEGATHHVRLDAEQLARIAGELGADLARLPYATCPVCVAQSVGLIELDGYGPGMGLGISWEGTAEQDYAHLICVVIGRDWQEREIRAGRAPSVSPITDFAQARRLMAWFTELREPRQYRRITDADRIQLAAGNAPALPGAPGVWQWHGASWQASCPPVGGAALVSVQQAIPEGQLYSLALTIGTIRNIARIAIAGRIAGEKGQEI